jgi:PAP_fibrillin
MLPTCIWLPHQASPKQALLDALAPLDRGRLATEEQRTEVLALFEKLEKANRDKKWVGQWCLWCAYTVSSNKKAGALQTAMEASVIAAGDLHRQC